MTKQQVDPEFAREVLEGLSAENKRLSSKYFYDEKGSRLFQQIMALDEYYPTNCEYEIFELHKEQLFQLFSKAANELCIVEFGAGDGKKTKVLLRHFIKKPIEFEYIPIDISEDAVNGLVNNLADELPELEVQGIVNEYFKGLKTLKEDCDWKKVVMFLGSNIGNFDDKLIKLFLDSVRENLSPDDLFLIGFDLKKDPAVIKAAYNDKEGVTAEFNLNLLDRINREMGADFNRANFTHAPAYNETTGEARSYIKSLVQQEVHIKHLNQSFKFKAGELIHTEISRKYTLEQIAQLASASGFEVVNNFTDSRNYFVDSVWKPKE